MKVYIFNREKFIKERLEWYDEWLEKLSKLNNDEKERMKHSFKWMNLDNFFKIFEKPREEVIEILNNTEWAKELDGIIVDNWIHHFDNHLEYYNRDINEEWCDVVEDENYKLDFRKTTNIYVLHDLLKEISNNQQMVKTEELINALNKFGKVKRSDSGSDLDLYFEDDSRDDIWIKEVDKYNCYITAYGSWDGRAGGMIFDNSDKYNNEGFLSINDLGDDDSIEFTIKNPYLFEINIKEDE